MFGPPPPAPPAPEIEKEEAGNLTASISITREPVGSEPSISFQYNVSLRIFGIALTLSKLEEKMNKSTTQQQSTAQNTQANRQSNTGNDDNDNCETDEDIEEDKDNNFVSEEDVEENAKSLAGKKKHKNKTF